MDNAKNLRAQQLLNARRAGWTNAEFWEAKALLDATPNSEMEPGIPVFALMIAWGEVEARRIDRGEHEGPGPKLHAALQAKWPVA